MPVTMLPPICRTDPPRFCGAVCQYPPPVAGQPPSPYLTGACNDDSAGALEMQFADDVQTLLTCEDPTSDSDSSDSYVVNPTFFSLTPVNVPVKLAGMGVVQCLMPPEPPPTESLKEWTDQQ